MSLFKNLLGFAEGFLKQSGGSVSMKLGSGYDIRRDPSEMVPRLEDACHRVVTMPDLREGKVDGKSRTWCNKGLDFVGKKMFCNHFAGLKAQAIHQLCLAHGEFRIVSPEEAVAHALKGGFGFGSLMDLDGPDHVATVMPSDMERSGSLGFDVPMLANVGKAPNGIKKASAAFPYSQYEQITWFIFVPWEL